MQKMIFKLIFTHGFELLMLPSIEIKNQYNKETKHLLFYIIGYEILIMCNCCLVYYCTKIYFWILKYILNTIKKFVIQKTVIKVLKC